MNWILFSNISLLVIYVMALMPIKNNNRFDLNRGLYIFIPILSIFIPFISFNQAIVNELVVLPTIDVASAIIPVELNESLSLTDWLIRMYIAGCLASLTLFSFRSVGLYRFIRSLNWRKNGQYVVAEEPSDHSSFSFFNYIYINSREELDSGNVVNHEIQHAEFKHSIDNIFFSLLKVLFWMNPVIYIMHRDLRSIHEYQVDAQLSKSSNTYVNTLLSNNNLLSELLLCNTYQSNNNLKKRIVMLYKKNTKPSSIFTYFFIIPAVLISLFVVSCSSDMEETAVNPPAPPPPPVSGEEVKELSTQPNYPGGMQAMGAFLGSEIKYPEKARAEGIEGTVYVQFVVGTDGSISNITLMKGAEESLDQEALRAVGEMPNWEPGEKNGEKVAVQYVLPVAFRLPQEG